jgi:lysophospholipase L1-like esterase
MPSHGRSRVRRRLLAAIGLLLLGELGVRAVDALEGGTGSLYDEIVAAGPGARFKMRPGGAVTMPERYGDIRYRFNRDGYRDNEPRPGSRRIVLLGDSVSFGLGVDQDEIYPAHLKRRLNADGQRRPWDVINLAIFAYNTADELEALEADGLKHRPELVILQFYMNDFSIPAAGGSAPPPPSLLNRLAALKNRVVYESALYRRLYQAGTGLSFLLFHDLRRNRFSSSLNDDEPRSKAAYLAATPDDGAVAAFRAIREIDRLARANGARLLVLLSPDEVQLFTPRFDGINRRFGAFCRRVGIDLVDPLPALRASPDRARLFNDGVHYSREGHAWIARLLSDELARRGLTRR